MGNLRKKLEELEKRIADLEGQVQSQRADSGTSISIEWFVMQVKAQRAYLESKTNRFCIYGLISIAISMCSMAITLLK